eukprot:TRINITY_DN1475_c0_g1_i1.p1 TRINITY_DN1475_c0_g1~~TRINITY_DN1475_c0_g1_i1.p1  ORF type:complete len:191 (+),score=36.76 TRINITY_DN1475_c0_g1_i1:111-683(+)
MAQGRRRQTDIMKLLMSNYKVEEDGETYSSFSVLFSGPKDSAYEEGTWKVRVGIPEEYPYKSPSIGFLNKIFHPNVDESSGSVCLDVINQTWSPMFDLVNVFEVFLPQLLLYPNPKDPLNSEAASLLLKDPDRYKLRVKEYIKKHATFSVFVDSSPESNKSPSDGCDDDGGSDISDLSSLDSDFDDMIDD